MALEPTFDAAAGVQRSPDTAQEDEPWRGNGPAAGSERPAKGKTAYEGIIFQNAEDHRIQAERQL